MVTIQALKPCFSLTYNPTLNKHRSHYFHSITSPNNVTNSSNRYSNTNNDVVIRSNFLAKQPMYVPLSNSRMSSVVSAFTVDDDRYHGDRIIIMGSYGSSPAITLERPKPELDLRTSNKPLREASLGDFDFNNGSNNGKGNVGGGDKGGGGSGDEDDYFEDFDDDDERDEEGLFRLRISIQELFDRVFLDAVLNEWQKTLVDLPAGMRQACELGLISSVQLVKYLMNEARPSFTRALYRGLSKGMSREFLGRIMADPSFLHKLLFEQFVTIACSVRSELNNRKERIKEEWDLALINVVTVAACNLVIVWSLAPCFSYANTFSTGLQNRLQKLPNYVFEASYRYREFDLQKRIQSFVCKAVQFSLVGFTAGSLQSALSNLWTKGKERRLVVPIPPANSNALGYGAFLGLYTNWRYQMICGIDKLMFNHFNVVGVSLFFTAVFRSLNSQVGEVSRTVWLNTENFASVPRKSSE